VVEVRDLSCALEVLLRIDVSSRICSFALKTGPSAMVVVVMVMVVMMGARIVTRMPMMITVPPASTQAFTFIEVLILNKGTIIINVGMIKINILNGLTVAVF
jgi:hypothetical protein